MRIIFNETRKGKCYYIIRSVYKNGKNTSETVETLGYEEDIIKEHHCSDPQAWMQQHLFELNEKYEEDKHLKVLVPFDPYKLIDMGVQQSFNIGYLFLQQLYYDLRLDLICKNISKRYAFEYDLNDILSRLIYGRIIFPGSKLSTTKQSYDLLEQPKFEYHHVTRALSVIAKEFDFIQSELYRYSAKVFPRKTGVLYYDCTNFYFETEQEDSISNAEADETDTAARKYGKSKQHQPSPLVQMGLFMDYSGIPLAISINRGNRNEQTTLIPLEEKILQDFELAKFVVCTDAGLSSDANKKFNNFGERSYVTTVSIKQMDSETQNWCLNPEGWHLEGSKKIYNISHLEDTDKNREENYGKTFYKQKYVEEYDEERDIQWNYTLIVTYSIKYRNFLKEKRDAQVARALKAIEENASSLEKKNSHDFRRFISKTATDKKGKKVDIIYALNDEAIKKEEKFDGFYAVETNLDDDIKDILKINRGRWEIEESFRIMKEEFRSRPVYLSRNERIKAHFRTCFIALLVYRLLERKLGSKYTCEEIVTTLKTMRVTKAKDLGYIPSYTRSELTDTLHETSDIRSDYEIIREKSMKGIIRKSKERQS
jgi:transposase